jgi:hypothetical protein
MAIRQSRVQSPAHDAGDDVDRLAAGEEGVEVARLKTQARAGKASRSNPNKILPDICS